MSSSNFEFEYSTWDMTDKEFDDKIRELLEENERKKNERQSMSNEDLIQLLKIQKHNEYVNNTFICPWFLTDEKGELLYKTREEFNKSIYKKLTNKELHVIQAKKIAEDKKYRERMRWGTEIDNEMYSLGMIG